MSSKISVVIAALGRPRFLRLAVESLLADLSVSIEIIVVDDASPPGCFDSLCDLPIRWIHLDKRVGPAAARNRGVKEAQGSYIAFIDSDDLAAENALSWRAQWLDEQDQFDYVCGDFAGAIDEKGKLLGSVEDVFGEAWSVNFPAYLSHEYLCDGGRFPCQLGLIMLRKKTWDLLGGLDESLTCAEDLDFFFRLSRISPIPIFRRDLIYYRFHGEHLSGEFSEGRFFQNRKTIAQSYLVHQKYRYPKERSNTVRSQSFQVT